MEVLIQIIVNIAIKIDKVTMQKYIKMYSEYASQAGMTNQEMEEYCTKLFPTLKRWKCTCTDECANGYNPNCTCTNPECHCTGK